MTAVPLSAFKLPYLMATYHAYLATKTLLVAFGNLMTSPQEKDCSWEAAAPMHRMPGLGR